MLLSDNAKVCFELKVSIVCSLRLDVPQTRIWLHNHPYILCFQICVRFSKLVSKIGLILTLTLYCVLLSTVYSFCVNLVYAISRNGCTKNWWKLYLIVPGIYWSDTRLYVSASTFLYHSFTFLYSHSQHAFVTSVILFVYMRWIKKWRSFICARTIITHPTRYLGARYFKQRFASTATAICVLWTSLKTHVLVLCR